MRAFTVPLPPALGVFVFVAVLLAAGRASATIDDEDALEDAAREAGGLDALEALGPLELRGGSFGFTLLGGVAWGQTSLGPTLRWQAALLVYLPLDRLLGTSARGPTDEAIESSDSSDSTAVDEAAHPGDTMTASQLSPRSARNALSARSARAPRWLALTALPGALALGGVAAAKDTAGSPSAGASTALATSTASGPRASSSPAPSGSPAPSASPSTATRIVSVEAPAAGVTLELGPPIALTPGAIRALIAAAWRASGLDGDEALADLAARAKASALAPEVRLRAHRTLTYGARVLTADTLADRTTLSDGTQTFLEARLTWRLDRLVFADEEIAVERVRLDRIEKRHRLGAEVVDLALAWQRARRAAIDGDLLPMEREDAALRAIEAFLALDALTVGEASRLLRATP